MRLPPWTMVALAGAGIGLLLWQRGCESQSALKQQIKVVEAQRDARSKVIAVLVSQAHPVDTVPVTKWLVRWDTLTDTLDLSDTAKTHHRILVADSTIRSCRAFVTDCSTQIANRDATINELAADTLDLTREVTLYKRLKGEPRIFAVTEADYSVPGNAPLLNGTLTGRAALGLTIAPHTSVEVGRERSLSGEQRNLWTLTARREWRLF